MIEGCYQKNPEVSPGQHSAKIGARSGAATNSELVHVLDLKFDSEVDSRSVEEQVVMAVTGFLFWW